MALIFVVLFSTNILPKVVQMVLYIYIYIHHMFQTYIIKVSQAEIVFCQAALIGDGDGRSSLSEIIEKIVKSIECHSYGAHIPQVLDVNSQTTRHLGVENPGHE